MSLERSGTAGRVSDHAGSDRIVDGRPTDRLHVVVYNMPPGDTSHVDDAHDVVVRASEDDEEREVEESWGHFEQAEAARRAVEIADRVDAVVWDDIIVLRYLD